jgi:phosphotransferase system HPr-like phosphotransfer protein
MAPGSDAGPAASFRGAAGTDREGHNARSLWAVAMAGSGEHDALAVYCAGDDTATACKSAPRGPVEGMVVLSLGA